MDLKVKTNNMELSLNINIPAITAISLGLTAVIVAIKKFQ